MLRLPTESEQKEAEDERKAENRRGWIGLLLIIGVLMVCFAPFFSELIFPPLAQRGGGYEFQTQPVQDAIWVIRSLGFMAFAAGLVERLALSIAKLGARP